MSKKTILVDFDGVLSAYSGWKGEDQLAPPLDKARHAMHLLSKDYTLVCFTTRAAEYVEPWLRKHGFPHMRVSNHKDPAFLQIDDRAICFQGQWTDQLIEQIRHFKPWWETTNE
jgi:hypothetical protein